ncbi:hypothetical protein [Streptosporangium sp. NPDC000396]|uniref:hypothetical protein n=1 Tax=Streptosporangium sp. NPDC000396 TaxID=3366185 RepID=UPI00368CFB7A
MVARLPENVQAEKAYIDGFQIIGDVAVWGGYRGDIWKVPLVGGHPEQILPDGSVQVSTWPWAYDEGERTVVNLDTGQEIRVAGADDLSSLACGPAWCVGEERRELWKVTQATMLQINGANRHSVPGDALRFRPPIHNRLVFLGMPTVIGDDSIPRTWGGSALGPIIQLYDVCTRQNAFLGSSKLLKAEMPWNVIKMGSHAPDGPIVYWRTTQNRFVVVDLARIAAQPCSR